MNAGTIEIYRPRDVSTLGDWNIGGLKLKACGLAADGRRIDDAMVTLAQSFVRQDVIPCMAAGGDSNGLGFVIPTRQTIGNSIRLLSRWMLQGDRSLPVFGNWR
ncbi:hypothetical protein [Ensifer adhaerens]|uniref:hypothetical protein n=1 Tax=Ensifer adhaerens TaxID=106592 RepID=UPI001CBAF21C|nr:hypothetical protein [Ensifer adhaerens]MBZ7921698.1 hypothetical protein [Ensifer adhaerens]